MIRTVILSLAAVLCVAQASDDVELQADLDYSKVQGVWYRLRSAEDAPSAASDSSNSITVINDTTVVLTRRQWEPDVNMWIQQSTVAKVDPANPSRLIVANPPDVGKPSKIGFLYTDYENVLVIFRYAHGGAPDDRAVTILGRRTSLSDNYIQKAHQEIAARLQVPQADFQTIQHGVGGEPNTEDNLPFQPNWDPRGARGIWYKILTAEQPPGYETDAMLVVTVINATTVILGKTQWDPVGNRWVQESVIGMIDPANPSKMHVPSPADVDGQTKIAVLYTDYENVMVMFKYRIVNGKATASKDVVLFGRRPSLPAAHIRQALLVVQQRLKVPATSFRIVRHGVGGRNNGARDNALFPNRRRQNIFGSRRSPNPFQSNNGGAGTGLGLNLGMLTNPFQSNNGGAGTGLGLNLLSSLFGNSNNNLRNTPAMGSAQQPSFGRTQGNQGQMPFRGNQGIPSQMPFRGNQGAPAQMPYRGNQGAQPQMPYQGNQGIPAQMPYRGNQGAQPQMPYQGNQGVPAQMPYQGNQGVPAQMPYGANQGAPAQTPFGANRGMQGQMPYGANQGRMAPMRRSARPNNFRQPFGFGG